MTTDEPLTFQFESRETLVAKIERDPANLDPWTGLVELEAEESSLDTAVSVLLRAIDAVSDREQLWRFVDNFVWFCGVAEGPTMALSEASVHAFYERWKIDTHRSAQTSLFFAQQFKKLNLPDLCAENVTRAEGEVHTGRDYILLALFLRDKMETPQLALAALQRGIAAHPRNAIIWDCVADTHRIGNSAREIAESSYQSFKQCRLDATTEDACLAWASFGLMLDEIGNYLSAEKAYRRAIEIDPRYRWATGKLSGLLRRRFARYHEAEKLALRCVEIDPEHAWSWFNLGFVYHHHLARFADAKTAYQRAIKLKPDYVKVWENLAALMAFETDAPIEAQKVFDKVFGLSGVSAWTYNQYGIFLRELTDRYDESEKALLHAIEMEPADWCHRLALAVLYEKRLLRFEEARKFLLEAKERGAPIDNIDYRLALIAQRRRPLKVVK
ncbi:tetratricopeptide repeat protein [Mesorhizobium sp. M0437]|uniref:tetratricopeptide repeat protein n=1 Tax=unclassified Mesorhizobium TaxID=325217 RepID=UPI0033350464